MRTTAVPHLQSTLSLWYLRSNSELMQDGDTGGTSASEQSSNRYGLEWANYYTPTEHLAVDFDIADSRAQFTQIDPDDAAQSVVKAALSVNGTPDGTVNWQESGPGGKLVPEAVKVVISSGVALHDLQRLFVEFAPALLWSALLDLRRTLSVESNGVAQWGTRLSIQQEMACYGRILEYAEPQRCRH